MATERISWRGLIWREVGSLSSTFFYFHLSPCLGAKIKCPDAWCWQGAGSGPCPLQQPPPWFAKKTGKCGSGWGGMELHGRSSPHCPLQPPGHPKLNHRPRPRSSCVPGVV